MKLLRAVAVVATVLSITACSDRPGSGGSAYDVTVTRTTYGIPHVAARDWGSLGYGYGYAFAEDNLCTMMDDFVTIRGERAKFFGQDGTYDIPAAGVTMTNVDSDFFWRFTADAASVARFRDAGTAESKETTRGWAEGWNRYVRELRAGKHAGRHAACADAAWLSEIGEDDLYRRYVRLAVIASSTALANEIVSAQPPSGAASSAAAPAASSSGNADDPFTRLRNRPFGSNMYAIGPDGTQDGSSMVFGNPHFPWTGSERLYLVHLTIPGEIDVEGAALYGVPAVLIGFGDAVAWTHTVSTAYRFGLFQLTLNPDNPLQYVKDGETRDLDAVPLEIEVREADGSITKRTRTLYRSEYGPMVSISVGGTPVLGWSNATAFTMRDANLANTRIIEQYFRWNTAKSLDEFEALHASVLGAPWVNTVASGPGGHAYYGDVTVVPNVSREKSAACTPPLGALVGSFAPGLPLLDGTRSECDWGSDADAPVPGIFGPGNLPILRRSDWVGNMNDSYWLTNPAEPVTGFAPVIGDEETARSLRTRLGILQAQRRIAGTDGRAGRGFTLDQLKDVVLSSQIHSGELAHGTVMAELCSGADDAGIRASCDALSRWDRTANLDAVGFPLWQEFWRGLSGIAYWKTPFDVADPVNTPRDFDAQAPGVADSLRLAEQAVRDAGFALDAPVRDVQRSGVNGDDIPLFGGRGSAGAFTVAENYGLVPAGYPVVFGNSYIQAVTWESGRVHAEGFLTYSQSTDPASPHFADFTRAYSQKRWHRFPFTADEIAAAKESEVQLVAP